MYSKGGCERSKISKNKTTGTVKAKLRNFSHLTAESYLYYIVYLLKFANKTL
jgi:hypothetical protein